MTRQILPSPQHPAPAPAPEPHATGSSFAQHQRERGNLAPIRVGHGCRFQSLDRQSVFGYVVELDGELVTIAYQYGERAFLTIVPIADVHPGHVGSMAATATIPPSLRKRVEARLGYALERAA